MRIVIVGAGEVGSSIAANLADTHDIVVIDIDGDRVDDLTYSLDVLPIEGDGTDIETLEQADVENADLLIASTDDDNANIVTCGAAKVCSDVFTIARVKNPQFLAAWERKIGAFDVDFMVCTDLLTAQTIVGLTGMPMASDVDSFADGLVQMTEFDIPAESPVANQTVAEADRFDSLTFAAIIRGDDVIIPTGETVIRSGDEIVTIGSPDSIDRFSSSIVPNEDGPDDIVIMGGGEIGYQTARLLEDRGFKPRLIERDEDRARWLAEKLPKTTVINNDATDQEFLERENVGMADVVISALVNDQQNLLATLLAKRMGAGRTVSIVDTGDFSDLFEAVGVDVAVHPREATAEEITRFTRSRRAENVAIIDDDCAEVIELELDTESVLVGRPISEAMADLPGGVVIGAIARNGTLITPRGDTIAEVGDHVVVFADVSAVEEVTTRV